MTGEDRFPVEDAAAVRRAAAYMEERGAARCRECGMPGGLHCEPGCGQPCEACKRAQRIRVRRELVFGAGLGTVGFLGAWLISGISGNVLHGALLWGYGLAAGAFAAMGRQKMIERRSRR